jgi:hypothetical protein
MIKFPTGERPREHRGRCQAPCGKATVSATGAEAGVDSAWEQEKLEATRGEMLENGDESHHHDPGARAGVGCMQC